MNKKLAVKKNNGNGNSGVIISLADGVCWVSGMSEVMYGELVDFGRDIFGVALNLEEDRVGTIIFGNFEQLKLGDKATRRDQNKLWILR